MKLIIVVMRVDFLIIEILPDIDAVSLSKGWFVAGQKRREKKRTFNPDRQVLRGYVLKRFIPP
jgi:general stress protein CsbA